MKESDRIATMARVLRAFGVTCEERPDGLVIDGTDAPLTPADVESRGDHRIAMTAAVLGLVASSEGVTRVRDIDCIGTSFPRFVGTLRALGANLEVARRCRSGSRRRREVGPRPTVLANPGPPPLTGPVPCSRPHAPRIWTEPTLARSFLELPALVWVAGDYACALLEAYDN